MADFCVRMNYRKKGWLWLLYMSRKKFAKDITVIGFINLLTALRGIIILPTITKLLGADNYGIWSQFMVTISLVAPVATLCLPYTLVRFLAGEKDEKQIQDGFYSVIAVVLGTVLLVTLLLFAFATPFSSFIGVETRLVKILALIIFLECFNSVFLGLFRAFQEVGKFSFFTLMLVFGDAGLILATSFMGLGLLGAISSLLAVRLAVFLLAGLLIVKKIGFVFPKFLRLKEYLHFGLPGLPSTIFLWIVQSSNRYLIGFFLGAAFVGYYAPADLLASTIISFFIGPFSFLLPAVLSKLFEENKIDEIRTYLRYSLKYFLMIGIPGLKNTW